MFFYVFFTFCDVMLCDVYILKMLQTVTLMLCDVYVLWQLCCVTLCIMWWHQWQICHRCQWHRWRMPPVSTSGKFATGINDTSGKFCHQFPLCCWHRWQICHRCQRNQRQICGRCQRRRWHRFQCGNLRQPRVVFVLTLEDLFCPL